LTVKTEDGQLVIARILAGGAVDRQGLLHVGDIIGEVNGVVVRSAEQLQVKIKENELWYFEIRVTEVFFYYMSVSGGNRTLQGTHSTENLTKFSREWFEWSTGRPIA